ncbi:MAG: DinB family protein [Gemmatimonadetes bacterium]|nr:DinB family protein [Gemmatimonadota bacterium]
MDLAELVAAIEEARTRFLGTIEQFDDTTARAPIGPDRWSPLEYLEHLVRAEEATVWRMFKAVEDARAEREIVVSPTPECSIEEIVDRTWGGNVDAPPLAIPELGASTHYWSARMRRNAMLVRAFADTVAEPELDGVAYLHPISGPFTMRQGLEFIRFHLDRHRAHLAPRLGDV